jgi:hypothetical protein
VVNHHRAVSIAKLLDDLRQVGFTRIRTPMKLEDDIADVAVTTQDILHLIEKRFIGPDRSQREATFSSNLREWLAGKEPRFQCSPAQMGRSDVDRVSCGDLGHALRQPAAIFLVVAAA